MKQYNFICENGHPNIYADKEFPPFACTICSVSFEENRVQEIEQTYEGKITGLLLTYLKTDEKITIPLEKEGDKILLGRAHHGSDVFTKILIFNGQKMAPVISSLHCSVTFSEGRFRLSDEGSTNGTFYGVNKLDCKNGSHTIENKTILYIGREEFFAEVIYAETTSELQAPLSAQLPENERSILLYRCNEPLCGYESPTLIPYCPKCKARNLKPIYG